MKKLVSLVLVVCLAACLLAGCSAGNSGNSSSAASSSGETSSEASASGAQLKILDTEYVSEEYAIAIKKGNTDLYEKINNAIGELKADGTIQAVIDKYISGVSNDLVFQQNAEGKDELTMCTNAAFPPYEYYEDDKIVGIDAEIAAAIADKLDMKLVIEDMEFGALLAAVESGKCDFAMAGMSVTEERKKEVDFTDTYATGVQVVIVKEGSELTDVNQLFEAGHDWKVGVQEETTGDLYATSDIEEKGYGTIERYSKGADAVQALITGKIDCVIIDSEPAKAFVEANNQ